MIFLSMIQVHTLQD